MSTAQQIPLADTMWHLTALVPWFGATEVADPQTRHTTVAVVLRAWSRNSSTRSRRSLR